MLYPRGLSNISNSKPMQLRSSVAISYALLLSLHCMLSVLVFRAVQLFLDSIHHDPNDLWDHSVCLAFFHLPSSDSSGNLSVPVRMQIERKEISIKIQVRNEVMWMHRTVDLEGRELSLPPCLCVPSPISSVLCTVHTFKKNDAVFEAGLGWVGRNSMVESH